MLDNLIKYKGIYHQIFGELLEKLIFRKDIEREKDLLKGLGYVDVDAIFTPEIDKNIFNQLSKIIFRFYENNDKKNETGK